MELDNKIRDLIERNASPNHKGATPGATAGQRNSCSLKIPGKTASLAHFVQGTTKVSAAEGSMEHAEFYHSSDFYQGSSSDMDTSTECDQSSSRKSLTNSLEQKIRCLEKQRKELLEVNQQWDQQFRSMKESYEKKAEVFSKCRIQFPLHQGHVGQATCSVQWGAALAFTLSRGFSAGPASLLKTNLAFRSGVAELKTKLDAAERFLSTQEKEREQSQRDSDRLRDQTRQRLQRQEKEKESLNEELHELKKENKLLKEKNALVSKKKEHYECEIKRLNKALQDALKIESSSFPEDYLGKYEMECRHEEMQTEMEVLKQQVQIYEEDFKKERSDRERLNQEKEELQQINQTSQSQLNRLNSQIKACQMEKEKLEKQLKQVYFPICSCSLNFHPCAPAGPGTAQDPQKHPPDYQWYAPDQFPPDVQHKANGFSSEKKVKQ